MKKSLIFLMAAVLSFTFAVPALANIQLAVDELRVDNVYYVVGEDLVTGEPIISPTMTISWTDPSSWADDIDVHEPDYYEVVVTNMTMGTEEVIRINEGTEVYATHVLDLHNELNLETGAFYKVTVQPYHNHVIEADGQFYNELADWAQEPEVVYALTDMNVEFISDEGTIQVIWDDVGQTDFEYRIVYAIGDYTSQSKDALLDNKEGEVRGLTMDSDDVTRFYDPIERRDKLSYTLDQNIYPGQVYSIMVEAMADYYNGYVINRNRNYPYIKSASTNVQLSLVEEGDYIRLNWEIPSKFQVGQSQSEYALVEATLMEYQDGSGRNLVIFDGDAATIGYYRVNKPVWETEYELHLVYNAVDDASKPPITPVSNRLAYVPSDYYIQPTRPYVPDLISEEMIEDYKETYDLNDVYDILVEDHLVHGYTYGGVLDDLLDEQVTFHVDEYNTSINLVWGAFQRVDVDLTSPTYGENIYDTNVYYDIWVTDQLETLSYAIPVSQDLRYSSTTDSHVITNDSNEIVGFRQQLNFYYDTDDKEIQLITPNELYYIKVQAKKVTAVGTLVSEPTIVSVYYTYGGDAFEPPTIAKPPLKVKHEETNTTGVTINWREFWTEIISDDIASTGILSNWQHQLWVDDDGNIFNELTENATYFPIYEGESVVDDFTDYMIEVGNPQNIISRDVDMGSDDFGVSDVRYNFLAIRYQTVLDDIAEGQLADVNYSFIDYYNDLIQEDKDGTTPLPWTEIVPYTDPEDRTYFAHRQENLLENNSYLFILYPYRTLQNGDVLYAHYPTPIIVSTNPEDVVITPDPTVPTIYTTDATDTSITVTWKYNLDFTYELIYSLTDDVDTAQPLPIILPDDQLDPLYPKDGQYFEKKVDDLFPLTTYYFWIKSIQTSNGSESTWSNPAIGVTDDVDAPLPPRGLGIATNMTVEVFGYELGVTEDSMILEWLKDLDDVENEVESSVTKSYAYMIEVADNPKFIDPLYIVSSDGLEDIIPENVEVLQKNVLKINGLVGNRHYYVRAKTKVVVAGSETGQLITKESVTYTLPIRIITLSTGDEYDGTIDPALMILPREDFELIYNDVSHSLEFRFRTDVEDSDGISDNQVDQRLISSLISDNVHEYTIDLRSFSNQEVDRRRITIPYSVIEAFDSYDIDLRVVADNMSLTVAAEAVIEPVNEQVNAFGVAPMLIIDMEELSSKEVKNELQIASLKDVSVPQKLQMNVRSIRRTDPVYYTDEPMTLELKTSSRYEVYEKDLALYVKDSRAKWTTVEGSYNRYEAMMAFETSKVGTYGLYTYDRSDTGVTVSPGHWSEPYRKAVQEQVTLEGLGIYNPESTVSEKAVVQAAYGTVMDLPVIDVSGSLDPQAILTLNRAGVKVDTSQSKTTITRQEAISMFVRTAEIAGGTTVVVTGAEIAAAQSVSGVTSTYAVNIAKAKAMGLVSDLKTLRPSDKLTYGEYFALWSRVLD